MNFPVHDIYSNWGSDLDRLLDDPNLNFTEIPDVISNLYSLYFWKRHATEFFDEISTFSSFLRFTGKKEDILRILKTYNLVNQDFIVQLIFKGFIINSSFIKEKEMEIENCKEILIYNPHSSELEANLKQEIEWFTEKKLMKIQLTVSWDLGLKLKL